MEFNRCFMQGLKALFVFIHCVCDIDPAKSTTWQLHSITTILPSCFTSDVISKSTLHSLSPLIFIHHRIPTTYPQRCRACRQFPTSFSPGQTYVSLECLLALPQPVSQQRIPGSVAAPVNNLLIPQTSVIKGDERTVMHALFWQSHKFVAEVGVLISDQLKSTEKFATHLRHRDLNSILASAKCRSLSS